jgi:hypothetical protein
MMVHHTITRSRALTPIYGTPVKASATGDARHRIGFTTTPIGRLKILQNQCGTPPRMVTSASE